jgi:hypothetical protein
MGNYSTTFAGPNEIPISEGGWWSPNDILGRSNHRAAVVGHTLVDGDAALSNSATAYSVAKTISADCSADLTLGNTDSWWQVGVRLSASGTSGANGYWVVGVSGLVFIYRIDAGVNTILLSTGVGYNAGETWRCRASGTTIFVDRNGSNIGSYDTVSDSIKYTAAGNVGVWYGPEGALYFTAFSAGPFLIPAGITGTTIVGGTVGKKRVIVPATINGTTVVGGALTKVAGGASYGANTFGGIYFGEYSTLLTPGTKPIVPANINGTTIVSGGVKALKRVTPAGITGTTVISGSVAKKFRVLPANIIGTTVVSGTIYKGITFVAERATNATAQAVPYAFAVSGITAGNFLTVSFTLLSTGTGPSVSDNQGNTYTLLNSSSVNAGTYIYGCVVATPPTTITINTTSSTVRASWVHEWRNVAASSYHDTPADGAVNGSSTGVIHTGAGGTAVANEMAIQIVGFNGTGRTFTNDSVALGFPTSPLSASNREMAGDYKPISVAGTTPSFNVSWSGAGLGYDSLITMLKPVPVGPSNKPIVPAGITGTTIVSGSVKKLTRVTPGAAITATSTIIASVQALRKIIPAGITATSIVSGAVTKPTTIRPIVPAGITGTTVISGSVRKLAKVSGSITGTTVVSGAAAKLAKITGAAITATSVVSGTITKPSTPRPISGGVITGTTVVSGKVTALHKIAPISITATSTVSGSVTTHPVKIFSGANITATSTITGSVAKLTRVSGAAITATSVISGAIGRLRQIIPASITATSIISGSVGRLRQIIPAGITGTTVVSGNVRTLHKFTATITATSVVSGRLARKFRITAAITGTTVVTGGVKILEFLKVIVKAGIIVHSVTGYISHGRRGHLQK